jgi:hypothetical protein
VAIPDPTQPFDIQKALVGSIFGHDSLVLYVFVLLSCAWTWYVWAKSTHNRLRDVYTKVMDVPVGMRVMAAFWAIAIVVAHTAYLTLSYFIASHLQKSIAETAGPASVDVSTWFSPAESPMQDPLFWLWLVTACLLVASGWWSALNDGEITLFHPIGWFLFSCGGIATLIMFLLNKQLGWLSLTYVVSAVLSQYLPGRGVESWRKRPTEDERRLSRPQSSW